MFSVCACMSMFSLYVCVQLHVLSCRVLLGTVLSLQPQRSVAQGESKEEKVIQYLCPTKWILGLPLMKGKKQRFNFNSRDCSALANCKTMFDLDFCCWSMQYPVYTWKSKQSLSSHLFHLLFLLAGFEFGIGCPETCSWPYRLRVHVQVGVRGHEPTQRCPAARGTYVTRMCLWLKKAFCQEFGFHH